ncbi:MAG: glycosyltransferase [Bacteriovoracaceae bacterium]|jgi:glycosyltransferase involved in cell wall biosynthesis|nr:glycosyltransferase [Bacteriovoracaceae bacterium]
MNFEIVIPTINRSKYLKKCLIEILSQDNDSLNAIHIIVNGKDSLTNEVLTEFSSSKINIYHIEKSYAGVARNHVLDKVESDWVYFIDDDAIICENYFKKSLRILDKSNISILGGPDSFRSEISDPIQKIMNASLSSPFAMGPTFKRHLGKLVNELIEVDEASVTLCNLWVKSDLLKQTRFNPSYRRNEENVLLNELQRRGSSIFYNPSLYVIHHRRENIRDLLLSIKVSGTYRMKMLHNSFKLKDLIYLAPIVFYFSLIFFDELFIPYFLIGAYFSIKGALAYKIPFKVFHILILNILIHISYAFGQFVYLLNIFSFKFNKLG